MGSLRSWSQSKASRLVLQGVQLLGLCSCFTRAFSGSTVGSPSLSPASPGEAHDQTSEMISRHVCVDSRTTFKWTCPGVNGTARQTVCCEVGHCCESKKDDPKLSNSALALIIAGGVVSVGVLIGTMYKCYWTDSCAQRYGRDPDPALLDKKDFRAPDKKEVFKRASLFSTKLQEKFSIQHVTSV